ncbi:MAG: cytochrome c, partial [Thermoguttaceae bacterium]
KEVKEQLSTVSSSLKRYAKRKKTDECAKFSAVIAVIGQAIICHGDETEEPDELEQWTNYCIEMRDAAAAVNSAMHASDEEAAKEAMANLAQSCENCHTVFKKEEE